MALTGSLSVIISTQGLKWVFCDLVDWIVLWPTIALRLIISFTFKSSKVCYDNPTNMSLWFISLPISMGSIQRRESISQRQAGCVQTPSRCTEQQTRQEHRGTLGLGQSGFRPLPLRQGSERVPRAALESAPAGSGSRSLTFPTPPGDSDRSCNVLGGKSWGSKTCWREGLPLLKIISLSGFKASASHLPAPRRREEEEARQMGALTSKRFNPLITHTQKKNMERVFEFKPNIKQD